MMSFNDFLQKYNFKTKATSNKETQQILSSLSLNNVVFSLRDDPFESHKKSIILHQSKGTYWVAYINEKYFDSYGFYPPQKPSKFIRK